MTQDPSNMLWPMRELVAALCILICPLNEFFSLCIQPCTLGTFDATFSAEMAIIGNFQCDIKFNIS
jgi:hypothetical protein